MSLYPREIVEAVKDRSEIVDLIGTYVSLKRAGSNYNGLCPFHSEKTPSFTVFPDNQSFFCFGCEAGGDAFTFIMRMENLDYKGSIEFLAKRHGIELPTDGREELSYSVCDRVLALLDENGLSERCVINTFSGKLHEYIYKKYGMKYRLHVYYPIRHLGTDMTLFPYSYSYCACVFSDQKGDFEYIDRCGIQPWAGASVRDDATVDLAIRNGAELITCNNPDVVLSLLKQKGYHE